MFYDTHKLFNDIIKVPIANKDCVTIRSELWFPNYQQINLLKRFIFIAFIFLWFDYLKFNSFCVILWNLEF